MKDEEIIDHVLVPKHKILDKKGIEAVCKKYGITVKDLPKILKDDPAVKMLGAKPGDVVSIERISSTSGISVYYRTVI